MNLERRRTLREEKVTTDTVVENFLKETVETNEEVVSRKITR